jgi:hypothetical protein
MLASDRELPVSDGPEKRAYVRDVFTAIAPTYDRLNRIISFRLDQGWRRYAIGRLGWERKPDGIYLDLCAGTLDFAPRSRRRAAFAGLSPVPTSSPPCCDSGGRRPAACAGVGATRSSCRSRTPPSTARWSDGECETWRTSTRGTRRGRPRAQPGSRLVILRWRCRATRCCDDCTRSISGAWHLDRPLDLGNMRTAYAWLPASDVRVSRATRARPPAEAQGLRDVAAKLFWRRVRPARGDAGRGAVRDSGSRARSARPAVAERAPVAAAMTPVPPMAHP